MRVIKLGLVFNYARFLDQLQKQLECSHSCLPNLVTRVEPENEVDAICADSPKA